MAARHFLLLVLGAALLPLEATVAYAEDGPPQTLLSAAGRLRPTETVERIASSGVLKVMVTVPGYASDPMDTTYWARIYEKTPEYRHDGFGRTIGSYDTRGPLAVSGDELRRAVQRLVTEEDVDAVALVGSSQGGVVIAESVRSGLSQRDNVATLTMLGSPVNGSTTARTIRTADAVATLFGAHDELSEMLTPVGLDDPALADLAEHRSFTPPPGIRTTQFYAVADGPVLYADARVPGATVGTVTPLSLSAHGGQINDDRTLDMVVAAVRGEKVDVSPVETTLVDVLGPQTDTVRRGALVVLAIGFVAVAVGRAKVKQIQAYAATWLD